MSRSEIDEIFAAPPKKKVKATLPEQPAESQSHPETILDPSRKSAQRKRRREKKQAGDEARFKDSRGSAPRRRTADGYTIYKEDELGISATGGDTPRCPFDCQCCY